MFFSQPANIGYFLITIDGITYNQTEEHNLSINSILLSTIERENKKFLCSNDTQILLLENSIQDFDAPCSVPQLLEKQLNNALHQAGIYTINIAIFGIEEAVDNHGVNLSLIYHSFSIFFSRHIYHVPNIFIQHINGTWLDSSLELNKQLYEIFISNDIKRLTTRVYRLSKSYSYFYSHPLSIDDRDYLEKLLLTLHNQQSKFQFYSFIHLFSPPFLL